MAGKIYNLAGEEIDTSELIEQGKKYMYPERFKEWEEFVEKNAKPDSYFGDLVVKEVIEIMDMLENGENFETIMEDEDCGKCLRNEEGIMGVLKFSKHGPEFAEDYLDAYGSRMDGQYIESLTKKIQDVREENKIYETRERKMSEPETREDGSPEIEDFETLRRRYKQQVVEFEDLIHQTPIVVQDALRRKLHDAIRSIDEGIEEKVSKLKEIRDQIVDYKDTVIENTKKGVKNVSDFVKSVPGAVKDTVKGGLEDAKTAKDRIDMDLQFKKIELEKEQREWEEQNNGRNGVVTGAVRAVNTFGRGALSVQAKGIATLTNLASKGLAIVGLRHLSERISRSGNEFALSRLKATTIAGRYSRKIAERGFEFADSVGEGLENVGDFAYGVGETVVSGAKSGIENVTNTAKRTAESVKGAAKNTIDSAKTTVKNSVESAKNKVNTAKTNIKEGLEDASKSKRRVDREIKVAKMDLEDEQFDWDEEHEDRSGVVTGAVRAVNAFGRGALSVQAKGIASLTSVASKGLAIIGLRHLSERVSRSGNEFALSRLKATTIAGRYSRKIAERGFETSDSIREAAGEAKDKVIRTVENVKTSAKTGIDNAKQGAKNLALGIGKKSYRGAAFATALSKVAVKGASDLVEAGKEKFEEASDAAKNYRDVATRKVTLTKAKTSRGIKGFFKDNLQKLVEKLGQSMSKDDETIERIESRTTEPREDDDFIQD